VCSTPRKVAQAVRGGAGRKVEHGGDRRLDRWCWTLRSGGSDRPMRCNQHGSVRRGDQLIVDGGCYSIGAGQT
jgi:hypothetical protein